MLNRKLLEVLYRLSMAERKQLRLFLESSYFTTGLRNIESLLRLYDYIIAHSAEETHPNLAKAVVFQTFFPDRVFLEKEKSPLDALASDLFGLVRRFLAISEWERKDREEKEMFSLLRFSRKHGLEDRFWNTVKALRKMQEETPFRDADYYLRQFNIEEEVSHMQGLSNTFEDDANLFAAHKNLDIYYGILKLEFTCALSHQNKVSHIDYSPESPLFKAVWDLSEPEGALDTTLNRIYKLVYQLINNPENEASFDEFEASLTRYRNEIPEDKYRDLKAYYRFFWGRRYFRFGDDVSRNRMFEIYKEHLENGYFYIDGYITVNALRVLVVFALKMGQFEWAKNVLDSHLPNRICGTKYPNEAHNLNMAEYYFYIKDYDVAKDRLIYRQFENPNFSILADVLLIKIYFETNDELADYRMKALEQKVRRTKISLETKARYYNFLNKLDKIIRYGWQKDNPKRAKLLTEIRSIPNIIEREWLLEKSKIEK